MVASEGEPRPLAQRVLLPLSRLAPCSPSDALDLLEGRTASTPVRALPAARGGNEQNRVGGHPQLRSLELLCTECVGTGLSDGHLQCEH